MTYDVSVFSVYVDPVVLETYLVSSVMRLNHEIPFVAMMSRGPRSIAEVYNRLFGALRTRFVFFVHPDVRFSQSLFDSLQLFERSDVGALGVAGMGFDGVTKWSHEIVSPIEVPCLDSCGVVVDREKWLGFDADVFDGLHLYVEDYCYSQRAAGRGAYVVPDDAVYHDSRTLKERGAGWGNYWAYRDRLQRKWREHFEVVTT